MSGRWQNCEPAATHRRAVPDNTGQKQVSGRRSRDKGARVERAIVHALKAGGFAAERVPLSGAAGGRYSGDIVLPLLGRDLCLEAKARADGFRELYGWIADRDVLIVKADRQEALVVVRMSLAAEVAQKAQLAPGREAPSEISGAARDLEPARV